jgi:chromosomal replication initiation ATPase DnaA
VADVLEAVYTVKGTDPLADDRYRSTIAARRLACHALREINELSYPHIGDILGYADHTTVIHHCSQPVDYEELRAVLHLVSEEVSIGHRLELLEQWG